MPSIMIHGKLIDLSSQANFDAQKKRINEALPQWKVPLNYIVDPLTPEMGTILRYSARFPNFTKSIVVSQVVTCIGTRGIFKTHSHVKFQVSGFQS